MFSNRVNTNHYICSYCGKYVPSFLQFQHDLKCQAEQKMFEKTLDSKYKCKLCGKIFDDIFAIRTNNHLSFHQSNENDNINSNNINNDQPDSDDDQNANNNINNNDIDLSTITLGGNNHNIIFRYQNNNRRNRRNSMDNNYINRNMGLSSSSSDNSNSDSFTSDKDIDKIKNPNYIISKIKDPKKLSENKKQCLICLEKFRKGEESIILPCIHLFHSNCILKWMKFKDFCPLCKKIIKPKKKHKK